MPNRTIRSMRPADGCSIRSDRHLAFPQLLRYPITKVFGIWRAPTRASKPDLRIHGTRGKVRPPSRPEKDEKLLALFYLGLGPTLLRADEVEGCR
jgi:hypothetical protein